MPDICSQTILYVVADLKHQKKQMFVNADVAFLCLFFLFMAHFLYPL